MSEEEQDKTAPPPGDTVALPAGQPSLVDSVDEETLSQEATSSQRGSIDTSREGDLSETPMAQLLFDLYAAGVTGALLLTRDDTKKVVYLRSGYPISVKSNVADECLGKILLWDNLITEIEWRESLLTMRQTNERQGSILVQMGALTPAGLAQGLSEQARFRLCETFAWQDGRYRLWPGLRPPAALTGMETTPAAIICDGVRSFMPHKQVLAELRPHVQSFLRPASNPLWRYQRLDIDKEAAPLLQRIDGTATVEELLKSSPLSVPETSALLYALICTEVAAPQDAPAQERSLKNLARPPVAKKRRSRASTPRVRLARLLERLRNSSPHEILGVPDDAPLPTLRLAFEKRAFERHPDHLEANQGEGLRSLAVEALTLTAEAFSALERAGEPVTEEELPLRQAAETVEFSAHVAREIVDARQTESGGETDINDRVQRIIAAERHHQKGLELIEAGSFGAAARVLARAVSACDEEGEFRASLAWATFQEGLDQHAALQALEHLDEAILTSPSSRAHLFRGYVLNFLDRLDEAVWAFQEALRREPDNEVAQCELERIREERDEAER